MASYFLTVTRLRVRKRYFTCTEFLTALLSSTHVTTDMFRRVIQPPPLKVDPQRVNAERSAHRAAGSQVTVSPFDTWQRRIVAVINLVPPDSYQYYIMLLLITVSSSVNINWIVAASGSGCADVCKVIARLRSFLNAHFMTVHSWQLGLMHSGVFLAFIEYMFIFNGTGPAVSNCR